MRSAGGVLLALLGVFVGLVVSIWLGFAGGIFQIIHSTGAGDVVVGLVRIVFLGCFVGAVAVWMIIIGVGLLGWAVGRKVNKKHDLTGRADDAADRLFAKADEPGGMFSQLEKMSDRAFPDSGPSLFPRSQRRPESDDKP